MMTMMREVKLIDEISNEIEVHPYSEDEDREKGSLLRESYLLSCRIN